MAEQLKKRGKIEELYSGLNETNNGSGEELNGEEEEEDLDMPVDYEYTKEDIDGMDQATLMGAMEAVSAQICTLEEELGEDAYDEGNNNNRLRSISIQQLTHIAMGNTYCFFFRL
jgi:hypothetical protein